MGWITCLRILYNFLYRNQTRWKRKTVRSIKYFWCRRRVESTMTVVWGERLSEPVENGTGSVTQVFTVRLGSVSLSFCGCWASSVEVGVPEMFGVTGVSDVVRTLVLTLTGDLEPVKRACFVRTSFDSGDKDDWLVSLRERRGFNWISSTIADYLIN